MAGFLGVVQFGRNHPSGAEALVQFEVITARLKSCPFKAPSSSGFFGQIFSGRARARLNRCCFLREHEVFH